MNYKYTVKKLSDFSINSDQGFLTGVLVAIRIDGDNTHEYSEQYNYNNKDFLVYAISNACELHGLELPNGLDLENLKEVLGKLYYYSFIVPADPYKTLSKKNIEINFYTELKDVNDNNDLGLGEFSIYLYNYSNKFKANDFKEIKI